jgi:PAS domain S-box-containing protein
MREMFGAQYGDTLGKPVAQVVPEAAEFYRRAIDAAYACEPSVYPDSPIKLRSGGTAWFDLEFTPIADEHGVVHGTLLTCNETTARVLAIRDLQKSRERLDAALNAGGIVGTWEMDVATGIVISDARFARLHGIDPDRAACGLSGEVFIAAVDARDREKAMERARRLLATGDDLRCEYRTSGEMGKPYWILATARAIRDEGNRLLRLSGVAVDITTQKEAEKALAESKLRFEMLAESIPQIVWSTDKHGVHDYFNRRWHEFVGLLPEQVTPQSWMMLVHREDWHNVMRHWTESLETGRHYDVQYRFRHHSGEYRWMRVTAQPLRGADGEITRWFGIASDIHEEKLLAMKRELVSRELNHRIKNLFAITDGLITLSLRENSDLASFTTQLRGRLAALNSAHDLIISRDGEEIPNEANSLHELLRRLLAPYDCIAGRRVRIGGDDIAVNSVAVTSLSLVFHELATNATKHGALAAAEGSVEINCRRSGAIFYVTWKEGGAQTPCVSDKGGFGSKLLHLAMEKQLSGHMVHYPEADGLRIELDFPCSSVAAEEISRKKTN